MSTALNKLIPLSFHPMGLKDVLILFAAIHIVIIALITPPTPSWNLVRAGIAAPLAAGLFLYFGLYPIQKCYEDQWGTGSEEYCYRVLPQPSLTIKLPSEKLKVVGEPKSTPERGGYVWKAETVPAPWTWEKFWWAHSLWWSMRGIGWNFSPTLPAQSLKDPYIPGSSRKRFVYTRCRRYLFNWIITDLLRAFMNLSSASEFFGGRPGSTTYASLSQFQRAIYSICVVSRVALGMDRSHIPTGVIMVTLGGMFGWETELCSPYGWTPLFGGITDIWKYPGLSQMWSRNWHHYFRAWLWKFGWIGIGENILRLPPSGPDIKGPPPHLSQLQSSGTATPAGVNTPGKTSLASGQVSPSHPVPTVPTRRSDSVRIGNLIKSLCVFGLTGWIHDHGAYFVLTHTRSRQGDLDWRWTDAIDTAPFFLIQPVGLVLEAKIKSAWRGWKTRNRPLWRLEQPVSVVFLERLVGFIWTWTWLGWTAGWFIDGLVRIGYYRRGDGQELFPSLFGGLLWGVWKH